MATTTGRSALNQPEQVAAGYKAGLARIAGPKGRGIRLSAVISNTRNHGISGARWAGHRISGEPGGDGDAWHMKKMVIKFYDHILR